MRNPVQEDNQGQKLCPLIDAATTTTTTIAAAAEAAAAATTDSVQQPQQHCHNETAVAVIT